MEKIKVQSKLWKRKCDYCVLLHEEACVPANDCSGCKRFIPIKIK